MSKTFKIAYSTAIFALLLVVASPTWAIYDPEAQKNCTPNATETVCLMRKPVEKETILPVTMITSLTEAIVKSPLILAEKVELLQTLLSNLRKFLGQTEVTPSEKTSYTLEEEQGIFKDGEYSFNLGCNTIAGSYELKGDKVTINPGASTLMACSEDLMKKDEQLAKDLAKVVMLKEEGQDLILSGGDVEIKLVRSK